MRHQLVAGRRWSSLFGNLAHADAELPASLVLAAAELLLQDSFVAPPGSLPLPHDVDFLAPTLNDHVLPRPA